MFSELRDQFDHLCKSYESGLPLQASVNEPFADLETQREMLDKDIIEFYNNSEVRNAKSSEFQDPTSLI